MRITFPNPLGPPISLDTSSFSRLRTTLPTPAIWSSGRRPQVRLLAVMLALLIIVIWRPGPPFPPSWKVEYGVERGLPQLNGDEGYGEGRKGRYVRFDVPVETGFNHQLQRILLHHHLAVLGNRSLAFEPIVIDDTWFPFRLTSWPWRSARIPLSAFITGTISGFEKFRPTPRAVPLGYYSSVCPSYKQRTYTFKTDATPNGEIDLAVEGKARLHQLQVLLAGSDDGCIRIQGEVFDDTFFDSPGPLDLFESFSQSPVMKHFQFSPTVLSILNRVMPQLAPESSLYDLSAKGRAHDVEPSRTGMWRHVLAMHLRRGSGWEQVCDEKGQRSAPFVGFNKYPPLPGNENVPPPPDMVEATRMGLYRAKCVPEILEIISRARRMRKNHPLLRVLYILTDADDGWVEEVRMWLASEGWDRVWVGSADVYPGWGEREVGVGVDMEVARRAGVFVGNGFSTTSSNIVLLRQRDGIHPDLTQFW